MKILATISVVFLLFSCNTDIRKEYVALDGGLHSYEKILQEHPGKALLANNCYTCHSPKTSEENSMAPPMMAVKMQYISEDTSKEDFVNAMVEWSKNPSKKNSKMPDAIKKYGLMPYQFYPESTIRQIADYMFDNEIEFPVWFQAHETKM